MGCLGMIYAGLIVFFNGGRTLDHPIVFRMPLLAMTSALSVWLTALISDSALEVDMLPLWLEQGPRTGLDDGLGSGRRARRHGGWLVRREIVVNILQLSI